MFAAVSEHAHISTVTHYLGGSLLLFLYLLLLPDRHPFPFVVEPGSSDGLTPILPQRLTHATCLASQSSAFLWPQRLVTRAGPMRIIPRTFARDHRKNVLAVRNVSLEILASTPHEVSTGQSRVAQSRARFLRVVYKHPYPAMPEFRYTP